MTNSDCGLRCLAVVFWVLFSVLLHAVHSQEAKANAAQLPANDFAAMQQQQALAGQQPYPYEPAFQADPSAYPSAQRLAGSSAYFSGLQQAQAQGQGAQGQQGQPGGWQGEMADLSQVLSQNVVAPQVSQFQQAQPDPLSASPYQALLKNLASTAPLYPPGPPGSGAPAQEQSRLFPGQILSPQAGFDPAGPELAVEKLDPPGPPHPPLNVENANYLTAVASIPQRIGSLSFNPSSLPGAFPHQTFQPNAGYANRGQNPPPPFNPWPPQYQSGGSGGQQQQIPANAGLLQQQQQQFQHQQQLRMAANIFNQQQRHPQSSLLQNSPPSEIEQAIGATYQNQPISIAINQNEPLSVAANHNLPLNIPANQNQPLNVATNQNQPRKIAANQNQHTKSEATANVVQQQQQQKAATNKSSDSEEMMKAIVTKQVYELKIVSYGETTCQQCADTDKILRNYSLPVHSFQMDAMANGTEMLKIIKKETGSNDMPQVFICGHFVGGFRQVKDLHKRGELKNLIKRCST